MGVLDVSSRVATLGLVGLVALDVALVGMALRSTESSGFATGPGATDSARVTASPSSPSSTPTATNSPTATVAATAAPAAPLRTMLVAVDTQRAWRASTGSCPAGGAKLATTSDGGKTWADAKAPLRTIVRIRPTDGQAAFVIGADSSCVAQLKDTTDGGGAWGSTSNVGLAWFRDPKNPSAVGAPGSSTSLPCGERPVLDLTVISTGSARVLCADGLVRATTDTGSSWTDLGEATGAVALGVSSTNLGQTYVARVGVPGCAGVQIKRVDQSVATSCIETSAPREPGQIALSLVSGGGWLAIGDTTMRSTDDLATWSVS